MVVRGCQFVSARWCRSCAFLSRHKRVPQQEGGADMNLYAMVGAGIGSPEAAALRTRLVAWHDAMVAHERKIRAGRTERVCDEDCPHAEARHLWSEAVETFGDGAQGLTF